MRTIDMMSARDLQDLRDAGRGHLIDGSERLRERADTERKLQREEGAPSTAPHIADTVAKTVED
jgi:hypothetical protein